MQTVSFKNLSINKCKERQYFHYNQMNYLKFMFASSHTTPLINSTSKLRKTITETKQQKTTETKSLTETFQI